MKQLILPVIIAMALLAACKKSSDTAVPETESHFMFVNGVPGATFGVKMDTANVATSVAYGGSSGYKAFKAQAYRMWIYDVRTPQSPIYMGQYNLRNARYFTAFLGVDTSNTRLSLMFAEDDLSPNTTGMARFRVVDLSDSYNPTRFSSQQAVSMDIWSDTSNTSANSSRFFRGMSYPSISSFTPVFADSTYLMCVRWIDFRAKDSIFGTPTIHFNKDKVYSLVLTSRADRLDTTKLKSFVIQHN
ncbi:DUF4397 domain-containing protein [Chitinophaga vietnamensis]|uniref:DUF4397 domain-containing protein n=1 Tax=Chitinophaga vietnamensis TaxID=2593957 RepID=UPI001177468C|nr:DUF4397 domain-containing protein [Chitinophaga vietnamensis]